MSFIPENRPYAFLSVYDKQGLEPLARALSQVYGYGLISTGGTYAFLQECGIEAIDSETITGFGDLLEGRVKSLHPAIFAPILAKRGQPGHDTPFVIDVVVVNLYPFEAACERPQAAHDPAYVLDYIDIGGSSLIRAAAKNHPAVAVLCDPAQYDGFLQELKLGGGQSSLPFRQKLALQAFQRSQAYEAAITAHFERQLGDAALSPAVSVTEAPSAVLPEALTLDLRKIRDLRYGENPHQHAALYGIGHATPDFTALQGKALSFNNLLDLQAAWALVCEFRRAPACAIIKHNNPCGVALGRSVREAYQRAFSVDPLSAFGGVVAFNAPVCAETARQMKDVFLEVVVAPAFEPEALAILESKKNLRLVQRPMPAADAPPALDIKPFGDRALLLQRADLEATLDIEQRLAEGALQVVSQRQPSEAQMDDLLFAWRVVKHMKSNAIVLAKDGRTVGLGVGQTSRIGALEIALRQACDEAKDAVMASDGFLPAEDNVVAAAQARVAAIIQPGGSIKDKDVIALANQNQMAMVATGLREFRH